MTEMFLSTVIYCFVILPRPVSGCKDKYVNFVEANTTCEVVAGISHYNTYLDLKLIECSILSKENNLVFNQAIVLVPG